MITSTQIQRIYKLGSVLGLIKNDELHTLVYGITGKQHVSQLANDNFKAVEHELLERVKLMNRSAPPPTEKPKNPTLNTVSAGMTVGQQKKVWHLMYELAGHDKHNSSAKLGDRLCGILRRELKTDAVAEQPFKWLNYHQGSRLIEILKKYVASAEQRVTRSEVQ